MSDTNPNAGDKVIQEFSPIGGYRVRVLERERRLVLDVREFVMAGAFEGFTRRGIQLTFYEVADLRNVCESILARLEKSRDLL